LPPALTSVAWSFMKANMPVAPARPKTARLPKQRPRHRCRRCPYYGPWGQCFDLRRKSGRCGDWVWYMRGAKQWRHLYVQPRDPRTPAQRHWRAKFGAASRKYSHSLTQAERRACIAAGSKLRSRPRLGQSGPLNGQHYSIRRDYSTRTTKRPLDAKTSRKPLQTKDHSRSTSDRYRTTAGPLPKQHACNTGRAGNNKPGRASSTREAKGLGRRATAPSAQGHPVHPSTLSARLLAGAPALRL
jgi:hypothetical protein